MGDSRWKNGRELFYWGFYFFLAAITLLCFRVLPKSEEKKSGEEEERIDLCLWYPWENDGEAYKKSFLEAVEEFNKAA